MIVHFDDIPEQDQAVVDGVPCTSALRTLIDLAPDVAAHELDAAVDDAVSRGLFTVAEAQERAAAPDMASRPGSRMLLCALRRLGLV